MRVYARPLGSGAPRRLGALPDPVRIGVAGLGYWGPNLARNFAQLAGAELRWCCDASEAARERAAPSRIRACEVTAELQDLLDDPGA
jgi:predicted dehydrogenase